MRSIKNFDLFQKISMDDVKQSTLVGSLVSISAISLMVYLLIMEFLSFLTPSIKRDTIVFHDPDQKSHIDINMGIRFPSMPCHLISLDQADQIGNHRMDIGETIKKNKMRSNKTEQEFKSKFVEVQKVIDAISEGEGCYISGHVPVSKVAGNFHVSHHNYAQLFYYLKKERQDLLSKISFSHQFNYLYFGDREVDRDVLKRFGIMDYESFSGSGKLPNYENGKSGQDYDYFIKLIPHILEDQIRGKTYITYQYSITHRATEYDEVKEDNSMPIIQVNYDLSPITVKISVVRNSLTQTLTHVCAIVGGVFVIFSLLNKILIFAIDSLESRKNNQVHN